MRQFGKGQGLKPPQPPSLHLPGVPPGQIPDSPEFDTGPCLAACLWCKQFQFLLLEIFLFDRATEHQLVQIQVAVAVLVALTAAQSRSCKCRGLICICFFVYSLIKAVKLTEHCHVKFLCDTRCYLTPKSEKGQILLVFSLFIFSPVNYGVGGSREAFFVCDSDESSCGFTVQPNKDISDGPTAEGRWKHLLTLWLFSHPSFPPSFLSFLPSLITSFSRSVLFPYEAVETRFALTRFSQWSVKLNVMLVPLALLIMFSLRANTVQTSKNNRSRFYWHYHVMMIRLQQMRLWWTASQVSACWFLIEMN